MANFYGTKYPDNIQGTDKIDRIYGYAGNDTLYGKDDNDVISGGEGNDKLFGESGNDYLYGSAGSDTLSGGDGNDRLYSWEGALTILAGSESNFLYGEGGNDYLTGNNSSDYLDGGVGNDRLQAHGGNDTLYGQIGNDILAGDDGNDFLYGGDGLDTISGGNGNDLLEGGNGDDRLTDWWGNDKLDGGEGNDYLNGGAENDYLSGGNGNDTLVGSSGNNTLVGGAGNDTMGGDIGHTIFVFDADSSLGSDYVYVGGRSRYSTLDFSATTTQAINIQLDTTAAQKVTPTTLTLALSSDQTSNVIGGSLNDKIIGDWVANKLSGGTGNDYIDGKEGADTLLGEAGNDVLVSGRGKDTLTGGTGADRFNYKTLTHSLLSEFDVITDFNANASDLFLVPVLRAGFSNVGSVNSLSTVDIASKLTTTTFFANYAAQFTYNGRNFVAINDQVVGFQSGYDAVVEVTGLTGTLDKTDFEPVSPTNGPVNTILIESKPVVAGYDHLYLVYKDSQGQESVIRGGPEYDYPPFGSIEVEVGVPIDVSEDRRVYEGNPLTPAQRHSTPVNLNGRDPADVWAIMLQQAQNFANAKLDYNAYFGAQNCNSVVASVLNAVGIDVLNSLPTGQNQSDFPGVDNLLNFSTKLVGTNADDVMAGAGAHDILLGTNGNDILSGGNGSDFLNGGNGNDRLTGGLVNDQFVFDTGTTFASGSTGVGIDTITDFTPGADKIFLDKTTFTALKSLTGDGFSVASEFTVVGSDALAATSGSRITYSATGHLFYNENGAVAGFGTGGQFGDFLGLPTLAAADFIIQA